MNNQNPRNYELHERNYVMEHFQHLMTEAERAAANAVVMIVEDNGQKTVHAAFGQNLNDSLDYDARFLLKDSNQAFRKQTSERILQAHRNEVYTNACPKCGRLPATPKAMMCLWCPHSWHDN